MEDLIRALGHINFYLADADEIFSGRKIKTFDRVYRQIYETTGDSELAECVAEDYCLLYDGQVVGYKDKWFTRFRNCYAASVIPSGQL